MDVCMYVGMQHWRENYAIYLNQICNKHINYASIQEVFLINFENQLSFWPKNT